MNIFLGSNLITCCKTCGEPFSCSMTPLDVFIVVTLCVCHLALLLTSKKYLTRFSLSSHKHWQSIFLGCGMKRRKKKKLFLKFFLSKFKRFSWFFLVSWVHTRRRIILFDSVFKFFCFCPFFLHSLSSLKLNFNFPSLARSSSHLCCNPTILRLQHFDGKSSRREKKPTTKMPLELNCAGASHFIPKAILKLRLNPPENSANWNVALFHTRIYFVWNYVSCHCGSFYRTVKFAARWIYGNNVVRSLLAERPKVIYWKFEIFPLLTRDSIWKIHTLIPQAALHQMVFDLFPNFSFFEQLKQARHEARNWIWESELNWC